MEPTLDVSQIGSFQWADGVLDKIRNEVNGESTFQECLIERLCCIDTAETFAYEVLDQDRAFSAAQRAKLLLEFLELLIQSGADPPINNYNVNYRIHFDLESMLGELVDIMIRHFVETFVYGNTKTSTTKLLAQRTQKVINVIRHDRITVNADDPSRLLDIERGIPEYVLSHVT